MNRGFMINIWREKWKSGKQWLIVGFLFLLLSLINYLRLSLVPAEDILFISMGIFALITGIFEIKQYYNRILYSTLVFVILFMMLVLYLEVLVNKMDLFLYYLFGSSIHVNNSLVSI